MSAAHAILFAALLLAAWTDLRRRVIPNWITYPALAACLTIAFLRDGSEGFFNSLLGTAICGGLLLLAWLAGALGGGDVKLAALIGATFGWADGLYALMWTFTLAAICMLSLTIWTDGATGVWRALRPQRLPDDGTTTTLPPEARPLYLAPAALIAAILITWPT
jgi:Flp pilus assembly protein protease CpaA